MVQLEKVRVEKGELEMVLYASWRVTRRIGLGNHLDSLAFSFLFS